MSPASEEGRVADLLRAEANAAKAAVDGEDTPGFFYALNWSDKPRRVVIDLCVELHRAADHIEELSAEPRHTATEAALRALLALSVVRYSVRLPEVAAAVAVAEKVLRAEAVKP